MNEYFVAQLANEILVNTTNVEHDEFYFIRSYKNLEHLGFTQKAFEASMFENQGYSLEQIKSKKIMLSDYIKKSF